MELTLTHLPSVVFSLGLTFWVLQGVAGASPNGEQKIKHSSPFCMKHWNAGHKSSFVYFYMTVTYFQLNLGCVIQFMFAFFCIIDKLSRNISNILSHDVKSCDQNFPSSWYFACILTNSASIYVVQDVAKIHARWMWLEFHWVVFTNVSTFFW
jgi:hypothetical protein